MKEKLQYLQNELKLDVKRRGDDDKHDKQLVHVMVVVQLEDEGKPPLYGISTALNNRKQGKEFLIDDVEPNMVMASGSPPNNQSKNRILVVVSNQTYFPNEPEVVLREKDASGKTRWEVVLSGEQLEIVKKAVVKFTAPPYLDRDIESDVQVELCLRDKKNKQRNQALAILLSWIRSI
ncbi:uncharacterized protein LOC127874757 isoform X1 [Dreissena polymorpha]|uniref:uncharacterized protein LOC127874757 isoform X1 n=1 Tax=Dreissena polymorpha TaxID=45954 RepID=UPI002263CA24|nr:uncharacterized protein LOC127874757 isoform X1 [Dreissena polymorpha]XP_052275311.1 uncharacterized protein LOC127874757 isoform X1 [Dreissena polymorpha]XP_052275312.1 uncharacterized protein LOC127874757 isoform X1 [Dreissena polymorpha]XP_052275314.1 uncharacterized protein LOC127874757 isoform X1 [Dreissena polymorpha]